MIDLRTTVQLAAASACILYPRISSMLWPRVTPISHAPQGSRIQCVADSLSVAPAAVNEPDYSVSALLKSIVPMAEGRFPPQADSSYLSPMIDLLNELTRPAPTSVHVNAVKSFLKNHISLVEKILLDDAQTSNIFSGFLLSLPKSLQAPIHQFLNTSENRWLLAGVRFLFPRASEGWKKWLIENIPDQQIEKKLGDFKRLLSMPLPEVGSSLVASGSIESTSVGSTSVGSSTTVSTMVTPRFESQSTSELQSTAELHSTLQPQSLWAFAADAMKTLKFMPDEQSLESQSVDAMQLYQPLVQGWKALLKNQFAAFRLMAVNSQAEQGTFLDRLEALVQSANLPKSITDTLTESIALLKSSYPQAVDLVNRAYPLVGEDIQSWFIDQLPDDFFILASQKLMEKIRGFDPMKEFDFVRNFSGEVQKSIKVTALRDFAKELTEKYYSFVSRDIKSLIRMGVPVLELGGQATQGEQLAAFAQKAGLVFQKGMQLFGDDIRDHDFRKVLAKLKEDVEPMSAIELDKILAEDDANNGPLTQLGIDRSAIDLVPVKAGTVAQVHIATVKEVVAIPANFGVKHEMITKKYAIKIMRPHLRESIDREFDMLEKSTQSEAIRGVLKDLKSSILGELDFSEEMNKSVVADNIYTANLSGGEKITAAKAVACSPHIMVQEFAEGKTIPSYYQDDFKQWSDAEKADFLHSTSKVLCRQLKDWISVAFNGHAKIPNGDGFIEGDRHCGNQLYDHKTRKLTLIDFGAGTYVSRKEREAIERFSIGVVVMRPKMIRRAFAFFLPEIHAKTPEGKQLRDRLDATFSDVVNTARTQEKINDLIEIFSDPEFEFKLDAELTPGVDLKKYVSDVLNRLSQAEKKALMNPRAVQQAQETLVRLFPTLKGNVALERAIDKTITQTYRRAFRLEQGRWFINDDNQVLLMNTNKKIMDALFDNGLKAPQVLVQLHRGSKFIEDQIRLNNEQKARLQYELKQSNQLTHELKAKLKQDNIGNLYVLAVAKGKLASLFRSNIFNGSTISSSLSSA